MKNWVVCIKDFNQIMLDECDVQTVGERVYFKRFSTDEDDMVVVAVFNMNNIAGFFENSLEAALKDCEVHDDNRDYSMPYAPVLVEIPCKEMTAREVCEALDKQEKLKSLGTI